MESDAILPVIVMTIIVAGITAVALYRQVQIREIKRFEQILDEILVVVTHQGQHDTAVDTVIKNLIATLTYPLPMPASCRKQYGDFHTELGLCLVALSYKDRDKYRDLTMAIALQQNLIMKRYQLDGQVNQ